MVLLMVLLGPGPVLFAALVGGVVALVRWRSAPRSALLVLVACVLQFAVTLFRVWLQGWWLPASKEAGVTILQLMGIWDMCSSVLHGVVIGLLVWAAFAGRSRARGAPPTLS